MTRLVSNISCDEVAPSAQPSPSGVNNACSSQAPFGCGWAALSFLILGIVPLSFDSS